MFSISLTIQSRHPSLFFVSLSHSIMATLNRLGMFTQRYTLASTLRLSSTKWRPAITATRSLPRHTFLPQQRSMATIQTTTDVASASYHFKKQKHLPYFLEYLMWVVFGSECLHLIWIKSDYKEYKERTQHKIALFKDLLALLESNSPVPESLREEIRMVMRDEKFNKQLYQDSDVEDDYLEKCKYI